jgi:hypothetical protein
MRIAYLVLNLVVLVVILVKVNDINCNASKNKGTVKYKNFEIERTIIDTQYVTVNKTVIKKGDTIFHDTTIYKDVPYLDTAEMACVLREYYAQKVFKDMIRIDSSKVYITDTIQMNKVLGRSVTLDMKYPSISKEVFYTEKKKGSVYAGGSFNTGLGLKAASVGIMYETTKGFMYGTSVGVNDKKLFYGLSLYKKL